MKSSISLLSPLLGGLVFGACLLAVPGRTTASIAVPSDPPTLLKHLRTELQSRDSTKREAALVDVIALANCTSTCTVALQSVEEKEIRIENETGVGSVVDLTELIPDLLEAYRSGPADGHRLLALSALINVGNEDALDKLISEGTAQSDDVNRETQRSLAGFYLEKYPELTEKTMSTKRLSLEDVIRARTIRVKRAELEPDS